MYNPPLDPVIRSPALFERLEPLPPDAELFNSQDLRELIEKARELARSGSREAAQELLAQLQELLENLLNDHLFAL